MRQWIRIIEVPILLPGFGASKSAKARMSAEERADSGGNSKVVALPDQQR
jgi:hypothetical protein